MTNPEGLRALAEKCVHGDPWYAPEDVQGPFIPQDRAFIAAANPATVLALLDENERLRGALDDIAGRAAHIRPTPQPADGCSSNEGAGK